MVKINVDVDPSGFDLEEQMPQFQSNLITLAGEKLVGLLTNNSPYDTGHLQRSWRSTKGTGKVTIKTSAEYAVYVNEGRGPVHVKNAKALKFTKGGKVVGFAKSAKATKGQKFVEKSIRELESEIPGIVSQAISKLK